MFKLSVSFKPRDIIYCFFLLQFLTWKRNRPKKAILYHSDQKIVGCGSSVSEQDDADYEILELMLYNKHRDKPNHDRLSATDATEFGTIVSMFTSNYWLKSSKNIN